MFNNSMKFVDPINVDYKKHLQRDQYDHEQEFSLKTLRSINQFDQ